METEETLPHIQFIGDGIQQEFSFAFKVFEKQDLKVFIGETEVSSEVSYEILPEGGGTVLFPEVVADGALVTIYRDIPIRRVSDFQEGATLRATVLNAEFDRQTAISEQIKRDLKRTLSYRLTDIGDIDYALPKPSPNRALCFNETATGLKVSDTDLATVEAKAKNVEEHYQEVNRLAGEVRQSEKAILAASSVIEKAIDSIPWEVEQVSSIESPISAQAGKYYHIDISTGDVQINLPELALVGEPAGVWIDVKDPSQISPYKVLVRTFGSDLIAHKGAQEALYSGSSVKYLSDIDVTPDVWVRAVSGVEYVSQASKSYYYNIDYVDGAALLDLPPEWINSFVTDVFLQGEKLRRDQWTRVGSQIELLDTVFDASWQGKVIELLSYQMVAAGKPSIGSVSEAELQDGAVTPTKLSQESCNLFAPKLDMLHVQHRLGRGVNGGSFSSGSYRTRTLNKVLKNTIELSGLSGNSITLPKGEYYVSGFASAYSVDLHMSRLYDISSGAVLIEGSAAHSPSATPLMTSSLIEGSFTLSNTSQILLQQICTRSNATTGMGFASSEFENIYANLVFVKIA